MVLLLHINVTLLYRRTEVIMLCVSIKILQQANLEKDIICDLFLKKFFYGLQNIFFEVKYKYRDLRDIMKIVEATIKRIEDLCERNSITINALAYKSGISSSTLKNIVYGSSNNPGIATIKILCDGLNISIKEFFDSEIFDGLEQEIY